MDKKNTFEVVPEDVSDHNIAYYVRGYLLYLIGSKVLPNSDNTTLYLVYWLQFLNDLSLSKLNDVAWGAAAQAMLHTSLGSVTRKNMKGPMWILEFFFMERFSKITNLYVGSNAVDSLESSPKAIPLFQYWSPLMVYPGKVKTRPQPQDFVLIRDRMTSKDVNWTSYLDYPGYIRLMIFFSRTLLFNFDQIVYHHPEKGAHQLEIVDLQPVERLEVLNTKSSKGCRQRNLINRYRFYIQMWDNQHLDSSCIKDHCPNFSLPFASAKNEDSIGPQKDDDDDDDDWGTSFSYDLNDCGTLHTDQQNNVHDISNDPPKGADAHIIPETIVYVRKNKRKGKEVIPENRHLDSSCIKDHCPTFSLPFASAKYDDFVGPQKDDDDISNDPPKGADHHIIPETVVYVLKNKRKGKVEVIPEKTKKRRDGCLSLGLKIAAEVKGKREVTVSSAQNRMKE